jgi:hypothetical protein
MVERTQRWQEGGMGADPGPVVREFMTARTVTRGWDNPGQKNVTVRDAPGDWGPSQGFRGRPGGTGAPPKAAKPSTAASGPARARTEDELAVPDMAELDRAAANMHKNAGKVLKRGRR